MFRDSAQRHRVEQVVDKWARSSAGADKQLARRLHIWLWANGERAAPAPFVWDEHDGASAAALTVARALVAAASDGPDALDAWFERHAAAFY